MSKHRIAHDQFSQLAVKLVKAAPPCMSSNDDWDPTAAALDELHLSLEHDNPAAITPLPDASGGVLRLSDCMCGYTLSATMTENPTVGVTNLVLSTG